MSAEDLIRIILTSEPAPPHLLCNRFLNLFSQSMNGYNFSTYNVPILRLDTGDSKTPKTGLLLSHYS